MKYRAFKQKSTGQWVNALMTTEKQFSTDAKGQRQEIATALGVNLSDIEAVDGDRDPRSGALVELPTPEKSRAQTLKEKIEGQAATTKEVQEYLTLRGL